VLTRTTLTQGEFPDVREDMAYCYHRKSGRVLIHGGWSQKFLDDTMYLDVSSIVGPPYAVYKLMPFEGPLTGHTEIQIIGEDFSNGSIKVTFTDGKNTENVSGKYVSPTLLTCKSPDWIKYSAGEVNLRVNINGEGLTVNIVKWTYFVNTNPKKCIAFGTGLFDSDNCGWGFPAIFKVQSKDNSGRNRNSGGEGPYWKPRVEYLGPSAEFIGENIPCRVEDCHDGTYDIIYVPTHPGQYHVELGYMDPVLHAETGVLMIKGSPWRTSFEDPWNKIKVKELDKQPPPIALGGVATVSISKKVVLFGGISNEVVCFDPENNAWERPVFDPQETGQGVHPPYRVGMTVTALDAEKAVIIGGHAPVEKDEEGNVAKPSQFYNDVHVLICEKGVWKWHNVHDVPGDKIKSRGKHSACLIPVGKKVIVFGGMSEEFGAGGDLLDSVSGAC
jgi:hypothetical protein